MSIKKAEALKNRCGPRYEVSLEEIATTERILRSIDSKNQILASVSQWLLIWQNVREISFRVESSPANPKIFLGAFKKLLLESIQVGRHLLGVVDDLGVSGEQLISGTGCSRKSVAACIAFLQDIFERHFGKPVSLDLVREVWAEFSGEPNAVV